MAKARQNTGDKISGGDEITVDNEERAEQETEQKRGERRHRLEAGASDAEKVLR